MTSLMIRRAVFGDLEHIVRIYMADDMGGHGDSWDDRRRPGYERAMRAILASPLNRLYVVVADAEALDTTRGLTTGGGEIVGTFQLTLAPGLVGGGRTRATMESVHVRPERRGCGIGARMVAHAISEARVAGAAILQLASNKKRLAAHRFYERLGFAKSHEGFKLTL
ncbi:MAG: GNAT family N-acetyltransferase [Hyphomicrobiales bacterium]|nr:GNAT family N-acetyltransferase [Hyphomicrobiales bacterium]